MHWKNRLWITLIVSVVGVLIWERAQEESVSKSRAISWQGKNLSQPLSPERPAPPSALKNRSGREFGLEELQSKSHRSWKILYDPAGGIVRTLSRGALSLEGKDVRERAQSFVRDYGKKLFGTSNLEIAAISATDRYKVSFRQQVAGMPIYGSVLSLIMDGNDLIRVQNDLISCPDCVPPSNPLITPAQAQASALRRIEKQGAAYVVQPGTIPVAYVGQDRYYPAYLVRIEASGTVAAAYSILVDARNSVVLRTINNVNY